MSLNMDRSGDDLDESQSSHPQGDQGGGGTATVVTPFILPILQKDVELNDKTSTQENEDGDEEEALPLPPPPPPPIDYDIEFFCKKDNDFTAAVAGELAESVVQAAIRELRKKNAQETSAEALKAARVAKDAGSFTVDTAQAETPHSENTPRYGDVRPLSGRSECFVSYFYNDGADSEANAPTTTPATVNGSASKVTEVPIIVKGSQFDGQSLQFSPPEESNKENWRQSKSYVSSLTPNATFAKSPTDNDFGRTYDSAPPTEQLRGAGVERIVPIRRYSPLSVDSSAFNVNDVSPQQTYPIYELRRWRHNTVSSARHSPNAYRMADFLHTDSTSQQRRMRGDYYRVEDASRDDLMAAQDPYSQNIENQFQRSSRATVRDIPIQRSASAFVPSAASAYETPYHHSREMSGFSCGAPITTGPVLPGNSSTTIYTASKAPGGGPQEEYYRREVLTRTLVTRSTEALSAGGPLPPPPPLGRSSPVSDHFRQLPAPSRDEISEEYWYKYSKNVEEEELRIRDNQDRRQREEEERRLREEEMRRRWEQQELEHLERLRNEREKMEKNLENQIKERVRIERERIERDRIEREQVELQRRQEWERLERERRRAEELDLEKRRELERLEKERLERERLERERLEMERLERERLAQEKLERERAERERIERERIEIERLEIERIERIKRERREKEEKERQRQKEEAERLEAERLEAERLERERIELERRERELIEIQHREAEQRERERREDELREQRRRVQEQRERELLEKAEREAAEREMQRKYRERMEQERLENLRREQERLEFERAEAERRERQRQEEERREKELVEAQLRAKERREQERLEEIRREAARQEEERREQERRARERMEAQERERQRAIEEQKERERLAALEAAAAERRAQRLEEERLLRSREELERRADELRDAERREAEKRERERLEEERRLAELRDLERRNAEQRDAERREAAEREANRRKDDRRSRDRLDIIIKEREEHERWEIERKRVLAEREAAERRRQALTSKETLERLTRKPYFSRENLSAVNQPEVTTKVERRVIERVDRTLWTSDDSRASAPLVDYRPLAPVSGIDALAASPTFDYSSGTAAARERIYNPRQDDLQRGGSTRASKYKARMEKARKEFLSHGTGATDTLNDPLSDRFRKSSEDVRRRPEYRGPLLQKFHDGELPRTDYSSNLPYGHGSGSPYDQTNSTMQYRSKSVLDYESPHTRQSRRDLADGDAGGIDPAGFDSSQHSRSKSADFMLDRRSRDEIAAPENELQKSEYNNRAADAASPDVVRHQREISEHEMRFRKSVERLPVPEWYRDHHTTGSTAQEPYGRPPTATTSGIFSSATSPCAATAQRYAVTSSVTPSQAQRHYSGTSAGQPWSYTAGGATSPAVGGIAFPPGMFDKYKDEIEDMRRSRTSLHQLGQGAPEHAKVCVL